MAAGILSIGMMLVATMFPVAIYLTSISVERTMAAIVADEAFAKIQLYGIGTPILNIGDYNDIPGLTIDPCEFSYNPTQALTNPQYYWSAVYRKLSPVDPNYQMTVFVARKTNPGLTYPNPGGPSYDRPKLIMIQSIVQPDPNFLVVTVYPQYVNPPTAILDNATGKIYRVIDRQNTKVKLDRGWEDSTGPANIWLIPPPVTGGRNADIEVYQRIIRF